jgi:recombination protein RecA
VAKRSKPKPEPVEPDSLSFTGSGCTVLDRALGGGWALGRISNVVGDRSSGKTLLAIEACANFGIAHPGGSIWYRESEHSFDEHYARSLGLPVERIKLDHLDTVEDFYDDLSRVIDEAPKPVLYIVDSLDALGDIAEKERDFRSATYGTDKAAALSELFRRRVGDMAKANVTLMIVSQTRSRIGGYGKAWVRAGGKALDFYASQVVHLTQTSLVRREVKGIERITGITVKARLEKNKVSLPFRECEFEITFGYGVDDHKACVAFLDAHAALNDEKPAALLKALRSDAAAAVELRAAVRQRVTDKWNEIETSFLPTSRKYPT